MSGKDFLEIIKTRRSCRKYKPEQITDEVNNILNNISMINSKKLTAFKDEKMYIFIRI